MCKKQNEIFKEMFKGFDAKINFKENIKSEKYDSLKDKQD